MKILLASMFLLASMPAQAALTQHQRPHLTLPFSAFITCVRATERWQERIQYIRNTIALELTTAPDNASIFIPHVYQAESPHDIPPLLKKAHLNQRAADLTLILRQLDAYREVMCANPTDTPL